MNKQCTKCGEVRPLEEYPAQKASKDGRRSQCIKCVKAYQAAYREANREKLIAKKAGYRADNREKLAAAERERRAANPEKFKSREKARRDANLEKHRSKESTYREANREAVRARARARYADDIEAGRSRNAKWRSDNPEVVAANKARRRAAKLNATPAWLTTEHNEQIRKLYAQRNSVSERTGIEHHVDHIVPLCGKTVSGLHVPWNLQVITASENLSKSNSFKEAVNA